MRHKTGHVAFTGAIWEQDVRALANTLHDLKLRPYHPDTSEDADTPKLSDTLDALLSGFGFFWTHNNVMNIDIFKVRMESLPLSWCLYRPNIWPTHSVIWDAPSQKKVRIPMLSGEIAMTASQAQCQNTRTSLLSWRSHLVSRGFAVVSSKHELLQAAALGAFPSDHIALTLEHAASRD